MRSGHLRRPPIVIFGRERGLATNPTSCSNRTQEVFRIYDVFIFIIFPNHVEYEENQAPIPRSASSSLFRLKSSNIVTVQSRLRNLAIRLSREAQSVRDGIDGR